MNYSPTQITASGGTVDPYIGFGVLQNLLIYSTGGLVMTASYSVSPTTTYLSTGVLRIRWNAKIADLAGFSVTICGEVISLDQLSQSGTFECFWDGAAWTVFYYADGTEMPQNFKSTNPVSVPVGGTLTLTAGKDPEYQILSGSPTTLTSSYTVTANTLGVKKGSRFYIEVAGGVTIGGNTMTVFGESLTANQALNGGFLVIATFDGTSWRGIITSKAQSISDLTPVSGLSLVGNDTNTSAVLKSIIFGTDFGILMRSGTSLTVQKLVADNFGGSLVALQLASVNIGSVSILTSNTTPVLVIPAPGVGFINIPLLMIVRCTFATVAYAANLNGSLWQGTAAQPAITKTGLLGFTSSMVQAAAWLPFGSSATQVVENQPTYFRTETADPTTGDGTITVQAVYAKIQI